MVYMISLSKFTMWLFMKINQESSEFSQWDVAMTHFCTLFYISSLLVLISIAVVLVYFVRDYSYEFIHAFLLLFMLTNDFAALNDFIENYQHLECISTSCKDRDQDQFRNWEQNKNRTIWSLDWIWSSIDLTKKSVEWGTVTCYCHFICTLVVHM